ncbi:hypothetical protein STTU_3328 [Streptomyces sp. Tu6071]|nr:hypothetical protein STTU_3328 [Streptomyces sp. Tu6071]
MVVVTMSALTAGAVAWFFPPLAVPIEVGVGVAAVTVPFAVGAARRKDE